jgi:hypothetical protein
MKNEQFSFVRMRPKSPSLVAVLGTFTGMGLKLAFWFRLQPNRIA